MAHRFKYGGDSREPRSKEQKATRSKERLQIWRKAVMAAYGGQCACCGEREIAFLTLDHVYNDGRQDRRQGIFGMMLYQKALEEFSDRYQVLCRNCNFAKWSYGVCPHRNVDKLIANVAKETMEVKN